MSVPTPAPSYSADPYSVVYEFLNDVNTPGGNPAAWALLGSSEQAAWGSSYSSFSNWADPISFHNIYEVSESGDTVTVSYDERDGHGQPLVPYTVTYTVDGGLITSSNR